MKLLSRLFLGKWWHWLLIITFVLLLWQAGEFKIHVIYFNWFLIALLAGTILGLLILIYGTPAGEQVTRDKLDDADTETALDRE